MSRSLCGVGIGELVLSKYPRLPGLSDRRNPELRGAFQRKSFLSLYLRVAATCQALAPTGSQVRSITVGSMDSTSHPSEKAARISS